MGKHARKRQRTGRAQHEEVHPLGTVASIHDDAGKDDEERRLESMLFGTPYVPSQKQNKNILVVSDEDGEDVQEERGGRELEHLLDTDLFFVDDANPLGSGLHAQEKVEDDDSREESNAEDSGSGIVGEEDESGSDDEEEEAGDTGAAVKDNTDPPKGRKAPAWTDPDDQQIQVSLASNKRLRKLRDAPTEDTVGGREYERRLRRQFEKINPTPEWAIKARKKQAKRRRASVSDGEDERADVDDLLASTDGILSGAKKSRVLPQGTLAIERLRDANITAKAEGEVKAIQFHPSPRIPVMLTASTDRRLRLFNIDGHSNPHLQTLHIPSLPLTNALFHPDGCSVLLVGPRPFYYTYDLQSGTSRRSPRGLWGTTFTNNTNAAESMETCAFSPDGSVLAVAGRRGAVHLVDWQSGGGQVVGSVKMNAGVKSVWWARGGEGRELMTLSQDSEVYVWDVGERRCVRRWREDGGFGSQVMAGDNADRYLAIGSNTGLVNVYSPALPSADMPKPLRTIGNLTTSISSLRFNHDSQLLAMASNVKKDQMRMIHLPSLTAFSNWPTSSTPLGHVTAMDFSRGSEYLAVGNNRGRVLLYQLRNYINQ